MIERFLRDLTCDVVRDSSFSKVRELVEGIIKAYLAERNLKPKPYKWSAQGEEILRRIQRPSSTVKRGDAF